MKKNNGQSGQAVIETAVLLPILSLIVIPTILILIHLFTLQIYFQHLLYDFLVCKETRMQMISCENEFQRQSRVILIGTETKSFYYEKKATQASSEVILKTWFLKRVKVHEQIHLPLQ